MGLSARGEDIAAAASHVETVRDGIDAQIAQIRSLVDGSRSVWKGEAQTAFNNLMERYDSSARKQSDALTTIAENIRKNGQGYDEGEQANLQSLHSVEGASATLDM